MNKKKELTNEYKLNPPPMGVYKIHNIANDKVFIGVSRDLPGILNRHKFTLKMGVHANKKLQAEWNEMGEEKFVFEVLDEITPVENTDIKAELTFFEDMWLEKLQPYDERGYNEKKKNRAERLKMISDNRAEE